MFIGHYAAGLALRKADQRIPLWWILLAACWLDILFGILLVAGVEKVRIVPGITAVNSLDLYYYPYSHGLPACLMWTGLAYLLFRFTPLYRSENKSRVALIISFAVFSHWILDWISHRPDMPIGWGDSFKVGLGLWNSIPATLLVESCLFIGGFYLYLRSTPSQTLKNNMGITVLAAVLLVMNYFATGGEAPPSAEILGYTNLMGSLVILALFGWLGRTRKNHHEIGQNT